ncbi:MAG TPA: AAA family ATPase [Syntrophus sp. (in: bacteria)]|nr:AAA family ATPase [Syntrophus sp. (in: bacteria)]
MYLNFYGFREKPFNLTPDPCFVFLSKTHKEAFAHLLYGINNRAGFIGLTGEVGSGKTTVLRSLFSQLDADHHRTALIFNPCLSAPELLQSINREFGISTCTSNSPGALDALNLFLLEQNREGRTVVLAIDEAQNLEASVLEQIRLISNLETGKEKLIQIILSGQPELLEILKREEMRQLSQRITVRYHLQPMDFQDTVHYITHRLEVAEGSGKIIFSRGALKRIYRYSGGLPRPINAACDRALMVGYSRDTARINSRIAAAGIADMMSNASSYTRKQRLVLIPAFAALAALLAAGVYFGSPDFVDRFIASRHVEAVGVQTKKDSVIPDEKHSHTLSAELGKISESESARMAFNTLAGCWNARPISKDANFNVQGMARAALDRQLRLYRFSGNLGALLRIDYPAGLEFILPGMPGKRFVSLAGIAKETLLIDPPIAGEKSLTPSEIEKYWTGQGFLLWKDPLNLQTGMTPGSKGERIERLQGLLKEAGIYSMPSTGVHDGNTISAVKKFQSSKGIEADGIVGSQTLMLLYRSIDRFKVPRLTVGRK